MVVVEEAHVDAAAAEWGKELVIGGKSRESSSTAPPNSPKKPSAATLPLPTVALGEVGLCLVAVEA